MTTFQQDLLLTINSSNDLYINKITDLLNNNSLLSDLSLTEAEKLINYIKDFNSQIHTLCNTIDKISNIKKENNLEKKIENELYLKILPIMTVYRTLLIEKYKNQSETNINDID